jgi:hydroxymethylbilane synthase
MPAVLPDGLVIAGVLPREDARDAVVLPGRTEPMPLERLVSRLGANPASERAACGESRSSRGSFRAQRSSPFAATSATRLRKLDEGQYDAIVLASAG